jgi:hypothetical protein
MLRRASKTDIQGQAVSDTQKLGVGIHPLLEGTSPDQFNSSGS